MYFGEIPPKLIGLVIYSFVVVVFGALALGLILGTPQPQPELNCLSEVIK
tara:strand:+ start:456 stop:605 length:150 start_codon:yes stop_codon:yes gene_type:complete